MFLRKLLLSIVLLAVFILSFFSCAQVGSPTGGAKDTLAPVLLLENPQNFSVNRKTNGIKAKVYFNEYIRLNDLPNNVYISPVISKKPDIKLNGKKIIIKINDSLRKNVTYSLSLGNAIVDNNEGNPYGEYKYVFSTGNSCDSLSVRGQVLGAQNHDVIENVWVMLYENYNDSTPILRRPDYIARTDTAGRYSIEYIHPGEYRIFAIKDENRNYLFDMPGEMIAFSDTILLPKAHNVERIDTLRKPLTDSTFVDSVYTKRYIDFTPKDIDLRMFVEDRKKQFIVSNKRDEGHKIEIVFNRSLWNDSLIVDFIGLDSLKNSFIKELSQNSDSLLIWTTDTATASVDSLHFSISFLRKDSLDKLVLNTDTLIFKKPKQKTLSIEEEKAGNRKNKNKKNIKEEKIILRNADSSMVLNLEINNNLGGTVDLNNDLVLYASTPLQKIDTNKIRLKIKKDTIFKPVKFSFEPDPVWPRVYRIKTQWEDDAFYELMVDTMAFQNYYHQANDTIRATFNTRKKDYYSSINLELTYLRNEPGILQLIKSKKVLREVMVSSSELSQSILFDYLPTGNYSFKLIVDKNGNKRWDTGNYLKKNQAEEIFLFGKEIPLKQNWDDNQNWTVK